MTIPQACLDLDFADARGVYDPRLAFSRASVGTFIGQNGLLQTAVAGVPRITFDPITGQCLGLLVEEARTNLNTYSNAFSSFNNSGITISTDSTIGPDGTTTGVYKLLATVNSGSILYKDITITPNTNSYCRSVWVKKGNSTSVRISHTTAAPFDCTYNFDTDTLSGTGAVSRTLFQNGWVRIAGAGASNNSDTTVGFELHPTTGGSSAYTYFCFPQVEVGAFPTSYIATTSTTVTRSADVASMLLAGIPGWNAAQGTIVVNAALSSNSTHTAERNLASLSDGTISNTVWVYVASGATTIRAWAASGGVDQFSQNYNYTAGVSQKTAISWASGQMASCFNGSTPTTQASVTISSSLTTLGIGCHPPRQANGTISRLALYPTAVTSADLQALTV